MVLQRIRGRAADIDAEFAGITAALTADAAAAARSPGLLAALAMGEYVITCRFQSNRARRYVRLHMSLSAFILGLSLLK